MFFPVAYICIILSWAAEENITAGVIIEERPCLSTTFRRNSRKFYILKQKEWQKTWVESRICKCLLPFLMANNPVRELAHSYYVSQCIVGIVYIQKKRGSQLRRSSQPCTVHPTEKRERDWSWSCSSSACGGRRVPRGISWFPGGYLSSRCPGWYVSWGSWSGSCSPKMVLAGEGAWCGMSRTTIFLFLIEGEIVGQMDSTPRELGSLLVWVRSTTLFPLQISPTVTLTFLNVFCFFFFF